ncbi:hypothetical protein WN51_12687 [Melipona quadrifasciata]|uniref:Uncharacterized protein n=1 Tax=Melipona quadrifasciata TaxID=166423 RepID=A0A0M9A372_9HYME|nr:hypothetical protein WN51_12687 [Melipona quadrifasciata]
MALNRLAASTALEPLREFDVSGANETQGCTDFIRCLRKRRTLTLKLTIYKNYSKLTKNPHSHDVKTFLQKSKLRVIKVEASRFKMEPSRSSFAKLGRSSNVRTVGLWMLEIPVYNEIPYVLTDWCVRTFLQPNDDFRLAIDQETRWIVPGGTARQKAGKHEREPFELVPASLSGLGGSFRALLKSYFLFENHTKTHASHKYPRCMFLIFEKFFKYYSVVMNEEKYFLKKNVSNKMLCFSVKRESPMLSATLAKRQQTALDVIMLEELELTAVLMNDLSAVKILSDWNACKRNISLARVPTALCKLGFVKSYANVVVRLCAKAF